MGPYNTKDDPTDLTLRRSGKMRLLYLLLIPMLYVLCACGTPSEKALKQAEKEGQETINYGIATRTIKDTDQKADDIVNQPPLSEYARRFMERIYDPNYSSSGSPAPSSTPTPTQTPTSTPTSTTVPTSTLPPTSMPRTPVPTSTLAP